MLTSGNESSNLNLTHHENRMSDASSVLKILLVKGVLFSTSVEVRAPNCDNCEGRGVTKSYKEPCIGSLSFFA